jgi:hypothetical protein
MGKTAKSTPVSHSFYNACTCSNEIIIYKLRVKSCLKV